MYINKNTMISINVLIYNDLPDTCNLYIYVIINKNIESIVVLPITIYYTYCVCGINPLWITIAIKTRSFQSQIANIGTPNVSSQL